MALLEINRQPSAKDLRWFAGLQMVFFGIVATIVYRKTGVEWISVVIVTLSIIAGGIGLVRPHTMRWIYIGWMYAAYPIGWAISHILIAAIWYVLLSPLGLLMRLTGRDPLHLKFDREAATYWVKHKPPRDRKQYFRQF